MADPFAPRIALPRRPRCIRNDGRTSDIVIGENAPIGYHDNDDTTDIRGCRL